MAVKTFMLGAGTIVASSSTFGALIDGVDQTAASRTDGWTVAKIASGSTVCSDFAANVKQLSSTFAAGDKPTALTAGNTNALRTPAPLTGTFAATAWTLTFAVRATTASSQAGRIRLRRFKSATADGSGATDLSGITSAGTTSGALSTTVDVTSVLTLNPGAVTLNNEYLLFVMAWEITTTAGNNSADVVLRTGQAAAGSRIVTPDFAAAGADVVPDVGIALTVT